MFGDRLGLGGGLEASGARDPRRERPQSDAGGDAAPPASWPHSGRVMGPSPSYTPDTERDAGGG
jgi:hypothetical protein